MAKIMTRPSNALLRIIAASGVKGMKIVAPNVAVGEYKGRQIEIWGPAMGQYKAHNEQQLRKAGIR